MGVRQGWTGGLAAGVSDLRPQELNLDIRSEARPVRPGTLPAREAATAASKWLCWGMGCASSLLASSLAGGGGAAPTPSAPHVDTLEARTRSALQAIIAYRARQRSCDRHTSFMRICLSFPVIREAFKSIRAVFVHCDTNGDGTIDAGELGTAMRALGAQLAPEAVQEMFGFGHVEGSVAAKRSLSFREFVICLCIGSVLQLFPLLRAMPLPEELAPVSAPSERDGGSTSSEGGGDKRGDAGGPGGAGHAEDSQASDSSKSESSPLAGGGAQRRRGEGVGVDAMLPPVEPHLTTTSCPLPTALPHAPLAADLGLPSEDGTSAQLFDSGRSLVRALRLVLEAFLLFDVDASGTIDRNEVLAIIDAENQSAGRMLAAGRAATAASGGVEAAAPATVAGASSHSLASPTARELSSSTSAAVMACPAPRATPHAPSTGGSLLLTPLSLRSHSVPKALAFSSASSPSRVARAGISVGGRRRGVGNYQNALLSRERWLELDCERCGMGVRSSHSSCSVPSLGQPAAAFVISLRDVILSVSRQAPRR